MSYFHLTIGLLSILFSAFSAADPLIINNQAACQKLADTIKSDKMEIFSSSIAELGARYRLIKQFEVGKGGAHVFLVEDKRNGEKKVLKIFPSIADENNKYNFREPYYTCLNSFISYGDLGYNITSTSEPINAFPRLFEVGITNAEELSGPINGFAYPYMVMEFVRGESLTSLSERAMTKARSPGYNLYIKDDPSFSRQDKQNSEIVLYQITQLMYKLKRIKINNKEYGFVHTDLNPGNIFVIDKAFSGTMNAGFGDIKVKDAPLVTFIDFGHSTSNFDSDLGDKVNSLKVFLRKTFRAFSQSGEKFYKNLNGHDLDTFALLAIAVGRTNADMRLYGLISRALYDSKNYINEAFMNHLISCASRTKCVEKAPILFAPNPDAK
ncbi:MAG TPA: hypothetical protein VEL47_01250 [Myxococcota bacterium]|nr:hypothetical protein [Myxococcota bacterium]